MKKDLLIEAGNIHRNIRQDLFDYFDTSLKTDYTFLDITEFIESRIKSSTQKYISPIFSFGHISRI